MAALHVRTADLPAEHRFASWHEMTSQAHVAMALDSDHRDDFVATADMHDFGLTQVSRLAYPPLQARRTERLIRQADPDLLLVSYLPRGRMVNQLGRDEFVGDQSSVLVYDTSRTTIVTNDVPVTNIVLQLPRSALGSGAHPERLLAAPIPADNGVGAVLAFVLADLAEHGATHPPTLVARLTSIVLDLLAATARLATTPRITLPVESRTWLRQAQIESYIRRRLADPALTPTTVAKAHGLSVRQLHRVFQAKGVTPSGWIRRQRLQQCQRDLADPLLATQPVAAIGARWGFPDPTAFNRAFREEYGLPPGEYRRQHMTDPDAHDPESVDHGA